jgi:hypothetical protein
MKKLIVRLIIAGVVILIIVVGLAFYSLDSIVKTGVETVGPKVTQVDVKLAGVRLSPFSGKGELKGFLLGNPTGYKSADAMKVGSISVEVNPASLMSEKIVVKSINIQAPEINFEGSLKGNNLSKIQENIEAFVASLGTSTDPSAKSAQKKIQVDDFVLNGAKVSLNLSELGGRGIAVTLPEIHLTGIGTGPDGITVAALTKQLMGEILGSTTKAVTSQMSKLLKDVAGSATDTVKGAAGSVKDLTKGVGSLFKK